MQVMTSHRALGCTLPSTTTKILSTTDLGTVTELALFGAVPMKRSLQGDGRLL